MVITMITTKSVLIVSTPLNVLKLENGKYHVDRSSKYLLALLYFTTNLNTDLYSQTWKNEHLIWDPVQYNVSSIFVFGKEVWTPSIYVANKYADSYKNCKYSIFREH